VFAEVVGGDEGEDVGLLAREAGIVEDLDRGVLDGAVHSFGLTVRPRVIGLRQLVLDVVLDADAIKEVRAEPGPSGAMTVLRQIGEGHSVVGQDGVDAGGEGGHHVAHEGGAVLLAGGFAELDQGELRDPIDREEHVQLAIGEAQFADVDVHLPDRRRRELASL